jgi:hypothetical protein
MFVRPPIAVTCATFVLLLVTAGFVLDPWGGWALFAPTTVATVRLGARHDVTRYSRCADGAHESWRQLRRSAHPDAWFRDLLRPTAPPAARVYGLAGLAALSRRSLDSALRQLSPAELAASVPVLDRGEEPTMLRLRDLLPDLLDGTLVRLFSDTSQKPEC